MSIILLDENDREISRDTTADDLPIVNVTPMWTGRFKLKVRMYSCRPSPCAYGVSVLGK